MRMRAPLLLVSALIALMVSTSGIVTAATPAAPVNAESLYVTPAVGKQDDTFVFVGSGFRVGATIDERFLTPEGNWVRFLVDGEPHSVDVADNGTFTETIVPNRDLVGESFGKWTAEFAERGGDRVWTVEFEIVR